MSDNDLFGLGLSLFMMSMGLGMCVFGATILVGVLR